MKNNQFDITIVISRQDIITKNIGPTLDVLQSCIETPHKARDFMERISISFHGYDQDVRELDEIPEVRDFVYMLDEKFPFWLFFLSKETSGLQCIMRCFLLPFLKKEVANDINSKKLGELLTTRWFPALNHISDYVGLSESEVNSITDRTVAYITR